MKSTKVRFYLILPLLILQLFALANVKNLAIVHAEISLTDSGYSTHDSVAMGGCPTATISYVGSPFCETTGGTQPVTLTGTVGGTYSSTTGLSINNVTGTITPSSSAPGTYTVTYTIPAAGGCSTITATTPVTINPPLSPVISCGASTTTSVQFIWGAVAGATAYALSYEINPPSATISGGSTSTPGYTANGLSSGNTVLLTLTPTGTGCFATNSHSCTANSCPVLSATISYAGLFCTNDVTAEPVTQTGTSGGTYSSTAGLTINAATGAITPATSTPGIYTVTYIMAGGTGCTNQTATTLVIITAQPSATISYNNPYCKSLVGAQPVTQTGTTGGTYSSTAGLTIDATTGVITPSGSTPGTYLVTYTMASGGCATQTATAFVVILPLPTPTFTASVATDMAGQLATYTTQSNDSNYQWNLSGNLNTDYTIASGGTLNDNSISVTWVTTGNKTIGVNYKSTLGCISTEGTTTTNVTSPEIVIGPPTGNASCISSLTGTVYQWQVNTGAGFTNISDGINYTGTNTNTLQLNNIPSSWYGYQYRCIVDGNNSAIFSLQVMDTWTGAVDNTWENPANWSYGSVPDNNTDVIINSGTIILNSNTSVRSLTLKPTVSFTVTSGNTLTVTH